MKNWILAATLLAATTISCNAQECPSQWKCYPTTTAPTLDGDLSEWNQTEGIETTLQGALTGTPYMEGMASTFKCQYDSDNIYLSLSIPGLFRFNSTSNEQCAAIATMQKIGVDATFYNMGGCADAPEGNACDANILETCDAHRVDIGAHWELRYVIHGCRYRHVEQTLYH